MNFIKKHQINKQKAHEEEEEADIWVLREDVKKINNNNAINKITIRDDDSKFF